MVSCAPRLGVRDADLRAISGRLARRPAHRSLDDVVRFLRSWIDQVGPLAAWSFGGIMEKSLPTGWG